MFSGQFFNDNQLCFYVKEAKSSCGGRKSDEKPGEGADVGSHRPLIYGHRSRIWPISHKNRFGYH